MNMHIFLTGTRVDRPKLSIIQTPIALKNLFYLVINVSVRFSLMAC